MEIKHSFSLFLEGISPGHSEADRQLLEAAKAGDVETVKVRYNLKICCSLIFIVSLFSKSVLLCQIALLKGQNTNSSAIRNTEKWGWDFSFTCSIENVTFTNISALLV